MSYSPQPAYNPDYLSIYPSPINQSQLPPPYSVTNQPGVNHEYNQQQKQQQQQQQQQQQSQQQQLVVTSQPGNGSTFVLESPQVKPGQFKHPVRTVCPHCKGNLPFFIELTSVNQKYSSPFTESTTTTTGKENGTLVWLCAVFLFFFFCPLFWLPCCIPGCKDIKHRCQKCQNHVGTFKQLH